MLSNAMAKHTCSCMEVLHPWYRHLARTVLLGKTGQQDIARHPMSGDIGKKKTSEIYILIILLSRHFDLNGIFSGFE